MSLAVNRMILNPEARQILFESLAFENDNLEWKRVISRLKARSAPMDEWIRNAVDIGSHTYNVPLTREVIYKKIKRNQNVTCG